MKIPFHNSPLKLDISGIAGFFGGEEAFAAMSSVHFLRTRRWLGWYNSPGGYHVAKKYGIVARSRIWDALYPGVNIDPTTMLELDGKIGPRYVAAHSGTRLNTTGHAAYLLTEYCTKFEPPADRLGDLLLTIITLPESNYNGVISLPLSPVDLVAIIPICYSIGSAVMCAIFGDWYCFAMVILGVICNGMSCCIIGSATLQFKSPSTSPHSLLGDGVLLGLPGSRVIVVKGCESAVARVTRGRFNVRYSSGPEHHDIGFASLLLTTQFLLQIFIIPVGQFFGQIMFLSSLSVSWVYNAYLASVDKQDLQKKILISVILNNPRLDTVGLPTWTSLAVFAATVCLEAKPGLHNDTRAILDEMIPNDTEVWRRVKAAVVEAKGDVFNIKPSLDGINVQERALLLDMLEQARIGYESAKRYNREPQQVGLAQNV